jgi:hypothetical protein
MSQTKPKFHPTKEMIEAGETLLMAMAFVETIKPIVIGYQTKVLADMKVCELRNPSKVVMNPEQSYLMSNSDAEVYYSRIDAEMVAADLKTIKEGCCPLLEAEQLVREAKRAVVDSLFTTTGIDADLLMRKSMDKYQEYIDLCLRMLTHFVSKDAHDIMERYGKHS